MVINLCKIIPTRLFFKISLVFLYFFFSTGCTDEKSKTNDSVEIVWENKQAIAIKIPKSKVNSNKTKKLKVSLSSSESSAKILGDYSVDGEYVRFTPLIPLTPELDYNIYEGSTLISAVTIPLPLDSEIPIVENIFPSSDSVPENMLKMYFVFSKPMQEVRSLDYIKVYDNKNDSLVDVFLDLQPELWNKKHTRLTLWLDPGRIKTDLIPNKERGLPIIEGKDYRLEIAAEWKDYTGVPLGVPYQKTFHVETRDTQSPDIRSWGILPPKAGSLEVLRIQFQEVMDAVLSKEVIKIYNKEGQEIAGVFLLEDNEKELSFKPENTWKSGGYYILVDAKLEDLAGNNLNRLFDTDLTVKTTLNQEPIQRIDFSIK